MYIIGKVTVSGDTSRSAFFHGFVPFTCIEPPGEWRGAYLKCTFGSLSSRECDSVGSE